MRAITQTNQNKNIFGSHLRQSTREMLEAERREIFAELESDLQPGEELAEGWQERDSAAERELREIEYLHRESLLTRLRQIIDAIERIDSGSYGFCSGCGRRIGKKRIGNDPAVALCLRCQEAAERQLS